MSPLGVLVIFAATSGILAPKSRQVAVAAFVFGALFVTEAQSIKLLGISLFPTRIFELAALVRIVTRREIPDFFASKIDRAVLTLYIATTAIYLLRTRQDAFNHIGVAIDSILSYFCFRALVRGYDDAVALLRNLALMMVPYAIMAFVEREINRTLWSSMGGFVTWVDWTRNGHLRCQASFRHPSLFGTFGASFLPLFVALSLDKARRRMALVGAAACLAIVWLSNSGGPANFALITLLGWCLWKIRTKMHLVRRVSMFVVIALWAMMKSPIWFVLSRASDFTGGDGWHRSELIDKAVGSIGQWWLAGMDWSLTRNWFPYLLSPGGGADICDQYVAFGLDSGILAIILFVGVIVVVFRQIGMGLAATRTTQTPHRAVEHLLWALGCTMVAHCFNWFGITYFDQIYIFYFLQLSMMATLTIEATDNQHDRVPGREAAEVLPDPLATASFGHS